MPDSLYDLTATLDLTIRTLARTAGVDPHLVTGRDDEVGYPAEVIARAIGLRDRPMRVLMLRFPFAWPGPKGPDGQLLVCVGREYLNVVMHCIPPSSAQTAEAKRRLAGLKEIALGLNNGSFTLGSAGMDFLASIGVEPVPVQHWLNQALADFPGLELAFYGPIPYPYFNRLVKRAKVLAVMAESIRFNSVEERGLTVEWFNVIDELQAEVRNRWPAKGKAPTNDFKALVNISGIEMARRDRWVRLRGLLARWDRTEG